MDEHPLHTWVCVGKVWWIWFGVGVAEGVYVWNYTGV